MNLNGTYYFYTRNAQGDIIGVLDSSGTRVVTYTYDTWGKVIDIVDTSGTDVGQINPYRYRGYRYDTETGLYYLQSRYYDPEVGRFLNADAYVSTGRGMYKHNVFAYTLNNPVNMVDPSGYIAIPYHLINQFYQAALETLKIAWKACATVIAGIAIGESIKSISTDGSSALVDDSMFRPVVEIVPQPTSKRPSPRKVPIIDPKTNRTENKGALYYHSTTYENAVLIMASGFMNAGEAGYVYAWRKMPDKRAIANSGAHTGVIISFRTHSSFMRDNWVYDPYAQLFYPVRTIE